MSRQDCLVRQGRRAGHRRKVRHDCHGRRGFTLAEMIAAIALLAVFSVIVVQLFAAAHTLARRTDRLDGAVLCARNIAEAWQAGQDTAPGPAPSPASSSAGSPSAAVLPASPFDGAGTLLMGTPVRLGFDSAMQPVAATDVRAAYVAELALSDNQPNGTDELSIVVMDPEGARLFELTAARTIRGEVAP